MPRRTQPPKDEEFESLVEAAEQVFGDMLEEEPEPKELPPPQVLEEGIGEGDPTIVPPPHQEPTFGVPGSHSFVQVKGGAYLPARRRIMWMRGEPDQHPLWTIDTVCEEIARGTFKGGAVEGGYARYRASVYDEMGRLISTGTKTEYSERFMDFAEKAETGAIARALAVAGYGTEAALDLDEGIEEDRIADAPVAWTPDTIIPGRGNTTVHRPINITPSDVGGLSVGGRQTDITPAQLAEIARLARTQKLGLTLIVVIENVLGIPVPTLPAGDAKKASEALLAFLQELTFEQAATLINALNKNSTGAQQA